MMSRLCSQLLPPYLINQGYVHGDEEKCNYELYLVELLNCCSNFMSLFKRPFEHQTIQSHGEPDAISGEYGLDFKLAVSTSEMQANGILKLQIWKLMGAVTIYGEPKNPKGRVLATRLYVALRSFNEDSLDQLNGEEIKEKSDEDVLAFREKLLTPKNLLFFFPYRMSHLENNNKLDICIQEMKSALWSDFSSAMRFRKRKVPNFYTYFCTIYNELFVLMRPDNDDFRLIDVIELNRSETYKELVKYKR